jgi:hypothetical protein
MARKPMKRETSVPGALKAFDFSKNADFPLYTKKVLKEIKERMSAASTTKPGNLQLQRKSNKSIQFSV